jgi:methyl-accepting chemotaxis protein
MSIGQRLAIGFGVVIALLVLLAGMSYMRIASLNKEMDTLVKVRYANTVAANHVKEDVSEATRSMLNVLIMTDPDQIKKELANTEVRSASATAQVAELARSTGDAEAAGILKALAAIQDKFLPAQTAFIKLVNEDRKDEAMMKFMFSLRPQQTRYFEQLDRFVSWQNAAMHQAGADTAAVTARTEMLILGLTAIAAALSLGVAWLATRSITRPLGQVVEIARRVADGDLTSDIAVHGRDETGQMMAALRHMNASLIRIVGELRTCTESISFAQVSDTIVAMDETTQQNAALVEEAAAAAAAMQEQAQRLARAVSVFKLQTTSPHAQTQTPCGQDLAQTQLARSNQALAAA